MSSTFASELIPGLTFFATLLFPGPLRRRDAATEGQQALLGCGKDGVHRAVSFGGMLEAIGYIGPADAEGAQHVVSPGDKDCERSSAISSATTSPGSTSAGDRTETSRQLSSRNIGPSPSSTDDGDEIPSMLIVQHPMLSVFFKSAAVPPPSVSTARLLRKTIRLLEDCDYPPEEVSSVLAHASAYFEDIYEQCGRCMHDVEVGYIMVALIYIAHCHVLDEACPLRLWHQRLCKRYCHLSTLDTAVLRLIRMRDYRLRLTDDDMQGRYNEFLVAAGLPPGRPPETDFCFCD